MELVVIALVCSQLAVPDYRNCVIDNSLRHMRLDNMATNESMCGLNAQIAAAAVMNVDSRSEYVKVMCVFPSVAIGHMPG